MNILYSFSVFCWSY